jgi:hypothetical protein
MVKGSVFRDRVRVGRSLEHPLWFLVRSSGKGGCVHVEKALLKLASQLDSYDEASLMGLWDKYQAAVQDFQPTRRWQEAVLVLGMIQSVRFKNQLFNHHLAEQARSDPQEVEQPAHPIGLESGPFSGHGLKERGKVIPFRPPQDD